MLSRHPFRGEGRGFETRARRLSVEKCYTMPEREVNHDIYCGMAGRRCWGPLRVFPQPTAFQHGVNAGVRAAGALPQIGGKTLLETTNLRPGIKPLIEGMPRRVSKKKTFTATFGYFFLKAAVC